MFRSTRVPLLLLLTAACAGADLSVSTDESAAPVVPTPGRGAEPAAGGAARDAKVGFAVTDQAAAAEPRPGTVPSQLPLSRSRIIRTGHASIEVDSLDRAIRRIGELATRAGGYLANTSVQTGENEPRTATLEVKVPAERYQGAFDALGGIGKVRSAATTALDVGEEYVDLTARMANARRLEERLVALLATRTGKLDDVLAVERELARIREEIERHTGRLRYLDAQVATSTLTITVFEPAPIVGTPGESPIVEALEQSWRNFVGVIAAGIALAGGALPIAAFGMAALIGLRWWLRRSRRTGAESPAT